LACLDTCHSKATGTHEASGMLHEWHVECLALRRVVPTPSAVPRPGSRGSGRLRLGMSVVALMELRTNERKSIRCALRGALSRRLTSPIACIRQREPCGSDAQVCRLSCASSARATATAPGWRQPRIDWHIAPRSSHLSKKTRTCGCMPCVQLHRTRGTRMDKVRLHRS